MADWIASADLPSLSLHPPPTRHRQRLYPSVALQLWEQTRLATGPETAAGTPLETTTSSASLSPTVLNSPQHRLSMAQLTPKQLSRSRYRSARTPSLFTCPVESPTPTTD